MSLRTSSAVTSPSFFTKPQGCPSPTFRTCGAASPQRLPRLSGWQWPSCGCWCQRACCFVLAVGAFVTLAFTCPPGPSLDQVRWRP